jgi:hypothetical protein
MRQLFSSEARIEAFWQMKRPEQRELWRAHLDWISWIAARFEA